MGKHSLPSDAWRPAWWPGRRRERDNLFERSFRTCDGCGDDVYVLAEGCRGCGAVLELAAAG